MNVKLLAAVVLAIVSSSCTKTPPAIRSELPGDNHVVGIEVGPCFANTVCTLRLVVRASGEMHINAGYPHRFEPAKTSTTTWSNLRAFTIDSPQQGTLATTFVAPASGNADIDGSFRFSICSADHCQIESPLIKIELPVGP